MPLSPLKYGTVKGRFIAAVADTTNDIDDLPDAVPMTGKVTFRPDVQAILVGNGTEAPVTVMPAPITAVLDAEGYLTLNGQRGVKLIATDNVEANPTNFTWTVELDLRYQSTPVKYPGWAIEVPADRETDLTLQGRVPSASGTAIIRGASVTSITAANGVITFALSDSTSHQVSIDGTLVSSVDGSSGAVDLTTKYAPIDVLNGAVTSFNGTAGAITYDADAEITVTPDGLGAYGVGSTGTIEGLLAGKVLPGPAKDDLAVDVEAPATTVGAAIARLIKTVRDALTPRNGKRPVGQDELRVNVKDYGAIGDGNVDDTAAIRAAVAALKPGDTLYFPAGKYYITGTIALTVACSVQGSVAGDYAAGELKGSVIFNKMGNASPFTSTANGVWFRDLYFISYQDMATIHANQCTAITFLAGSDCGVERCVFNGWYQWMDFQDGSAHTIRDNRCSLVSRYGIRIRNLTNPDNGDSVMTGNLFISNDPWRAEALVRQESSGGLKVFGNKFLSSTGGAARFLDVAISDGAETSILTVTGNSFEYARISAIRLTLAGPLNTGSFGKINITGNQFTANGMTGAMIDIDNPGASTKMQEITVSANTAWGHQTFPVGGFVKLDGVNVANVTGNQFRGGPIGVDIGDRAYNVMVDKSNFFHEIATPIRGKRVADKISYPSNALIEIDAPRAPAPTLTASTTGGTLAAGTYTYALAYRDGAGLFGQLGDKATVTTTGTTGSVSLSWAGWPTLGTAARIYRGFNGALTEYRDVSGATTTDTGAGWTAGVHPGTSTYPAVRLGSMSADPLGSGGKPVNWILGGQVGIGTRFPQSDFHIESSLGLRVDSIGSATGDHGVSDANCIVIFTAMSANRNVWLPTAANKKGRILVIKDGSGQAGTYTITVAAGTSGQNVDGGTSVPINTPYGKVTLVSNGSHWFTV